MRNFFLFVFVLGVSFSARSYFEPTVNGAKPREMNGLFFDKYKNFTKTWHLVTVRYRQDSGELRFTYANDLAFKAMKDLKPNYPKGAMFAKVAFGTDDDPQFSSSKVPSGARRYQFMIKDKKKYADSDGWNYALFDGAGNLFDEDMKAKTQSCVACHRIVPERDFVFSRQMQLHYDSFSPLNGKTDKSNSIVAFEQTKFSSSPESVKAFAGSFDFYNGLIGKLREHAFSGTLDEVLPLLTEKSRLTGAPSGLIIDDKNFSLVVPKQDSKKCVEQNSLLKPYRIVIQFNSKLVRDAEVCL